MGAPRELVILVFTIIRLILSNLTAAELAAYHCPAKRLSSILPLLVMPNYTLLKPFARLLPTTVPGFS